MGIIDMGQSRYWSGLRVWSSVHFRDFSALSKVPMSREASMLQSSFKPTHTHVKNDIIQEGAFGADYR